MRGRHVRPFSRKDHPAVDRMVNEVMDVVKERDELREKLAAVVENLGLRRCKACGHYHQEGHVCYECGRDPSD